MIYCEDCEHVVEKKGPTYIWLCIKAPQPLQGFVTKEWWDDDPPYYRCKDVNRFGNCAWFKQCAPSES